MKTGIFFDGNHACIFLEEKLNSGYEYTRLDYSKLMLQIANEINVQFKIEVKLNYKAWYQGIKRSHITKYSLSNKVTLESIIWKYHNDRTLYISLINSGIETVFLEVKKVNDKIKEKGIDVALAVGVINNVNDLGLECVIICTNDSDFSPLLHNLRKKGILTIVVGFNTENQQAHKLKLNADYILSFDSLVKKENLKKWLIKDNRPDYQNLMEIIKR